MPKKKPAKRGPKPETLKVKGPLDAALTTFLNRKRPATGWPVRKKPAPEPELALSEEE